jgi:arylsulfatase A-like enzyme
MGLRSRSAAALALCALLLGAAGAFVLGCTRQALRPRNLLLVLLDTTRADRLSCYGGATDTTPAIDELARSGARFEAAYSQSSLTPVSAASVLTGTLPPRTGVRSLFVVGGQALAPDVPSLFDELRGRGLATAAFVSAKPMGRQYGLDRGFDVYDDDLSETARRHGIERFADAPQRPAEETTERALAWLGERGREPFALLLHWFDAHDPSFVPPREFLARRLQLEQPASVGRTTAPQTWPELYRPESLVQLYAAEVAYMDSELARILGRLEELGVRDDTLVCVIADHGEAFGEHGFWTHGILYEEQLHVPLVLAGPGVPPGLEVPSVVRLVDLAPTLLELFGIPAGGAAHDGRSLVPLLARGEPQPPPGLPEVYAEVHHAAEDRLQRDTEMYSLRVGEWKYIHRPVNGRHELYDLARDPLELENLYTPEHAMGLALQTRLLRMGAVDGAAPSLEGIAPEELERLRALGYL